MKSALLLALVAVAAVLSSCNTTIGLGRDMRILGDGMEKSANKTRGSSSGDTSGAPVY
ncbi:MAG: Entericidin EcnAB [Verrucomicrobiota bacterium]